jgi:hypothetical protein
MNYIELINSFWASDWSYSFNSTEIALYFSILNHANKARWPESFTLPNSVLLVSLKCTKDHLIRARRRLCKAGLIKYRNGDRFNPGKYTIIAHLKPTQDLPDTYSRPAQELPKPDPSEASFDKQQNGVEKEPDLLKTYPTPTQDLPEAFPSLPNYINKTKLNKTKHKTHRLSKDNLSVKLTNASSELADSDQSLKNEREVSSEEKAEESQKSDSTVETSPSKAKPSNSIDEFFDGLLSGKSMNEMLFDSPPKDEATYIPPNDSQLFSPSHTPFENIRLVFVECCPSLPAPKEAKSWTEKRKRTVKSRWKKNPSMDFWYGFFQKVEDSDFLSGRKTDWRASFDWIMKPANFEKISEGCYDNAPDQMAQVLDRVMRREW